MSTPNLYRVELSDEQRDRLEDITRNGPEPAREVRSVCDNLNTHGIAWPYGAFPADEAQRLARRLEIHHTPRSGSWLNVAEIELGVLSRQCRDRRIGSPQELAAEIETWQNGRNPDKAKVK